MTILGKFEKQPREVEIYAFIFRDDMSDTDEITAGYCALTYGTRPVPELELYTEYVATPLDEGALIYTSFAVTMPETLPDGYRLMVSNIDQDSAIAVNEIPVPARAAVIVRMKDGQPVVEMSATAIVVSAGEDQRIRVVIAGGVDRSSYKAQATAITAEGRVMEDEMILKIKEE